MTCYSHLPAPAEASPRDLLDPVVHVGTTRSPTVPPHAPEELWIVIGPDDEDKADSLPADARETGRRAGVRFLGHRSDVERCYHALDVYVLASWREGFPRSAMEAAACGLPIIATDIRGCRQVVDHRVTGLLVPVRDPVALAAAISELVGDAGLRSAMSAAAVEKARVDFDQDRVIATTLATYDRVLADR